MARVRGGPTRLTGGRSTYRLVWDDQTGDLLAVQTTGQAVVTVSKVGVRSITTTFTGETSLTTLGITTGSFNFFGGETRDGFVDFSVEARG